MFSMLTASRMQSRQPGPSILCTETSRTKVWVEIPDEVVEQIRFEDSTYENPLPAYIEVARGGSVSSSPDFALYPFFPTVLACVKLEKHSSTSRCGSSMPSSHTRGMAT